MAYGSALGVMDPQGGSPCPGCQRRISGSPPASPMAYRRHATIGTVIETDIWSIPATHRLRVDRSNGVDAAPRAPNRLRMPSYCGSADASTPWMSSFASRHSVVGEEAFPIVLRGWRKSRVTISPNSSQEPRFRLIQLSCDTWRTRKSLSMWSLATFGEGMAREFMTPARLQGRRVAGSGIGRTYCHSR